MDHSRFGVLGLAFEIFHRSHVRILKHRPDAKVRVKAANAIFSPAFQEGGERALCSVNGACILEVCYAGEVDPYSAGGIRVPWQYP